MFAKAKTLIHSGKVSLDQSYSGLHWNDPNYEDKTYSMQFKELVFKTTDNLYKFTKTNKTSGAVGVVTLQKNAQQGQPLKQALQEPSKYGTALRIDKGNAPELVKLHKGLKLVPKVIPGDYQLPYLIDRAPIEVLEGNHTYRIVTSYSKSGFSSAKIVLVSRDDDKLYDYVDRGFFYDRFEEKLSTGKIIYHDVIANELDVHTMSIFALLRLQPKLAEHLRNGCFMHTADAQMIRLKMEKRMSPKLKAKYESIRAYIEQDYQSNTSLIILNKLIKREVEKTTINQITITQNTATYENISVEADDLLEVLYKDLNFSGEFDIYTIVDLYSKHIQKLADELAPGEDGATVSLPKFKVNGIEIEFTCNKHMARKLNGVRINKTELQEAIYRASCHRSAEEYLLFLKRISKMSLRWHDVLANGLKVKIHDGMSYEEYNSNSPSSDAPSLKFYICPEDKCIKIKVAEDRGVRVSLGKLIQRVGTINKKTNNRWSYSNGRSRDVIWARNELVGALKDACTFTKKTKAEDGTITEETETLITKDDVLKIIKVVNELKVKAIERSKQFLATAVKVTGAEEIEFLGKRAYKVKGSLREYAVVVETAKVYDFETKQYRCIVNDNHFRGAGYDDVAARLYVLKNDSVMQEKIGTLKGQAQPQYENHHDRDLPRRDVDELGVDLAVIDQLELA